MLRGLNNKDRELNHDLHFELIRGEKIMHQTSPKVKVTDQLKDFVDLDKAMQVIEFLSSDKDRVINPTINFDDSTLSYPQLTHIADDATLTNILKTLCAPHINILEMGMCEKVVVCPQHPRYLSTSLRLYCPECLGSDIVKLHLVEHNTCGSIFEQHEVLESSDPKCVYCKNVILDPQKELRKLGRWYECRKCKNKFDGCVTKLYCRKFEHDFDITQAMSIVIPNYRLKMNSSSLQLKHLLVQSLKKLLTLYGFVVEDDFIVQGKSGMRHKTSVFAYDKNRMTIAIYIKDSESVDNEEISSTIMKVLDIAPTLPIFIITPPVFENISAVTASHGIELVTGNEFSRILSDVERLINERLKLTK